MSKQLIEFIPEPYRNAAIILFALFPWLVVGIVAFKAWRIAVNKRHNALAYRALEERCRCIVDTAGDAFPKLRELRGQAFIDGMKAKLMQAAQVLASIESKNLTGIPVELRWYVNQLNSIQHYLEEHDYPHDGNPAGMVLLALGNPAPSLERAVREQWERNEALQRDFRAVIALGARYAPQVTFCDSLPKFAEDVMDVALEKARAEEARFIYDNAPDIMARGSILPKPPFEEWLKRIHNAA